MPGSRTQAKKLELCFIALHLFRDLIRASLQSLHDEVKSRDADCRKQKFDWISLKVRLGGDDSDDEEREDADIRRENQWLALPARVGRPSRNLLEWNGSEMNCKRRHGLLSVSEMETSWCDAIRWIECGDSWDESAQV